ncbi:GyrI-like domain-containing protein [Amycolatopsis sp. 195334CR]|uniref:GyrI-like domain-containing protein n=1 Tax=Amycolatopsis sp. 195334CR TaxID=2814588 RepID=UPI001A8F9FF4|nr:GyrI-like domain-containing protein [Amycolatopsis sp. 195334CR]MBN6041948.1 GyrI-like domain-containing protein [Amycolatopsis sp. 195334CR]
MSTNDVTVKAVPPVRVASVSGIAESDAHEHVGPVAQALFERLFGALERDGVPPAGTPLATYAPAGGARLTVTAACPVGEDTVDGVQLTVLDGIGQAACYVHHGTMATIDASYRILTTWIEDNGYRTDGTAREVHLVAHPDADDHWRTELQLPITPR